MPVTAISSGSFAHRERSDSRSKVFATLPQYGVRVSKQKERHGTNRHRSNGADTNGNPGGRPATGRTDSVNGYCRRCPFSAASQPLRRRRFLILAICGLACVNCISVARSRWFLFSYRATRISQHYLNRHLIPCFVVRLGSHQRMYAAGSAATGRGRRSRANSSMPGNR